MFLEPLSSSLAIAYSFIQDNRPDADTPITSSMGVSETLPIVLQVLWLLISIPFAIILGVYGSRAADTGFPHMATAAPAAYQFVILGLLILVVLISLLLRFGMICCSTRGIGLCVVLASLVIENLAIAFYGAYGTKTAEVNALTAISTYVTEHPLTSGDKYTIWWAEWLRDHAGKPDAVTDYVDDRTITPAKLAFGFGLTWFILHTVVFYLIILPRDGLPEAPLAGKVGSGYSV
jgi:hypothetical protein